MSNVFGTWEASSSISTTTCAGNQVNVYNSWVLTDPELHKHALDLATGGCGTPTTQSPTMDGSGMMVNIGSTPPMLTLKDGTQIVLSKSSPYVFLGSSQEDTNGNLINATDTLGRNLVTTTQGPTTTLTSPLGYQRNTTSYTLYTVQDSNGSSQTYRVDYALTDLATHFCGSLNNPPIYVCTDVSPGQYSTLVVPGKLTLPDGQTYQFSWTNQTPGELGSVILPTGGSISYTYGSGCTHQPVYTGSNYNGTTVPYDCKAGVGSRTVSVNSVNSIWNYSADSSGHPKLTDPNGNDQIHVFSYVSASSYLSPSTVETQVSYYQGSSSTGKLLKQITTDYTGEANGCIPECMVVLAP